MTPIQSHSQTKRQRIRLGIQKSGRLADHTRSLLNLAGIHCEWRSGRLDTRALDFPLDLMLVRDDDIPRYVAEGVCDLGIVGENMVVESLGGQHDSVEVLQKLNFGRCRLALAVPESSPIRTIADFKGLRIATSYPTSTAAFLKKADLDCALVKLGGSVEIAPAMGIADGISDLVSTGATLSTHRLREVATLLESEAVLIKTKRPLDDQLSELTERLCQRTLGVLRAEKSKYIMMNAPRDAIETIRTLIPGLEEPTVMTLWHDASRVAIHAVAPEPLFWETIEQLKKAGASSILVVPIEKIIS
jgi:ATP phosphoribosyltransferase